MEADYRNTRSEIGSAIYGVNVRVGRDLNELWWKLSDVSKLLSDRIVEIRRELDALERITEEVPDQQLPLENPGQQQDHRNH